MIVTHLFPEKSNRYRTMAEWSQKMDRFMTLKPLNWFAVWIMITSGTSAQQQTLNRYIFWDTSLTETGLLIMLAVTFLTTFLFKRSDFKFENIDLKVSSFLQHAFFALGLFLTGWGWLNLFNGEMLTAFKYFFPYLLSYISLLLMFQINVDEIPEQGYGPGKMYIVLCFILTLASSALGVIFDDPVISTAAAVYAPFLLVAIFFPIHQRHIQRIRVYPLFIFIVFISARLPWLLIPILLLFFTLRTYHYFRYNIIYPTFSVDHD